MDSVALVGTNDSRLSDARTPTSHVHGNISNDGKIGTTTGLMVKTTTRGVLTTLAQGSSGQFLRYDGTWDLPTGKKVARFVVGTSTAGWTAADCDYLCDGTSDEVEIMAAINALPETGGEIFILSGVYNIAGDITLWRNYVTISGSGQSTILKRMFNNSAKGGLINTSASYPNCTIRDLQIDGNKAVYTSNNNYGFYATSTQYYTIKDVVFNNCYYGAYIYLCSYFTVNGCSFINSTEVALWLYGSRGKVSDNLCNLCGASIVINSSQCVVTGNMCMDSTTYGILLVNTTRSIISNNYIIRGTGLATDYTESQHTIRIVGTGNSYNLISNNNCMGKTVTNEGGTGNTLVNNKFDDSDDIQAFDGTLVNTDWTGSAAPYTKAVTVTGILAAGKPPTVDVTLSETWTTAMIEDEEWAKIKRIAYTNDTLTFYATEVPAVSLNFKGVQSK